MPEITLQVDLPEVTETSISVEVRCGDTAAYVYEHGRRGSGDWAAWTSTGGSVVSGGTIGYPFERALHEAREHVRREERRRRFHAQSAADLAEVSDAE